MVTLAALAGTIYFGLGWYRYNLKLEKWRTEVLMEVPVDFSKKGSITGHLTLTTLRPCKVEFVLVLDTDQAIDESILKPLSGMVNITDNKGSRLFQDWLNGDFVDKHRTIPNAFVIRSVRPWEMDPCTVDLTINNPVSQLQDVRQRVLIKYQLCGLESMVLIVYVVFASLCAIAGLIAACVLYQMRKSSHVPEVAKTSDEDVQF